MNALLAETIARTAHAGQYRPDGKPYVTHLERVAAAVPGYLKAAAWLHDTIEDTGLTAEKLKDALGVTPWTVAVVDLVTRREGETYEDFIERIATAGNPDAIAVKLADLRDNLTDGGGPKEDRLRLRYEAAVARLERVAA